MVVEGAFKFSSKVLMFFFQKQGPLPFRRSFNGGCWSASEAELDLRGEHFVVRVDIWI